MPVGESSIATHCSIGTPSSLAAVVGAGLGAAVVRALDGEGITDLVLPWGGMSLYLGLAALVGVLAAVLPSIKAARLNVLAAIAHD